jgi:thioredoxin 1
MAADQTRTFTDDNFEQDVLRAATPVLVDFWGERCPSCDVLAPQIDALAAELDGKASIGKLKVEDNPTVTMRYRIRGIPALLVFKDGELVDTMLGASGKSELRALVEKHL